MGKTLLALAAAVALVACASMDGPRAVARLQPTAGNSAEGSVQFQQAAGKVVVSGEVRGLKPNAAHGFHIHEKGDCSAPDGMSAAGHFNPDARPHGEHGRSPHHAGDLRTLQADANGVATFRYESEAIAIGAGANDIVGRGLIVHRDPDDFKTQPTGNSGARIACAVIVKA